MIGTSIAWNTKATVVRLAQGPGDPQLMFEGSLAAAVDQLSGLRRDELARYRIALPDRLERPRLFQGGALVELVAAVRLRRKAR